MALLSCVHVWSSYGLGDFQIKLGITDGPLGANKLPAPLCTRHKSCTAAHRFCSEVSFYKDFQIRSLRGPQAIISQHLPLSKWRRKGCHKICLYLKAIQILQGKTTFYSEIKSTKYYENIYNQYKVKTKLYRSKAKWSSLSWWHIS